MGETNTTTQNYVQFIIPNDFLCVYQRLLNYVVDNGIDLVKTCPAECDFTDKKVIHCWNIFQSSCAAYNLGNLKVANFLHNYVKEQLDLLKVEGCGTSYLVTLSAIDKITREDITDANLTINSTSYSLPYSGIFAKDTKLTITISKTGYETITIPEFTLTEDYTHIFELQPTSVVTYTKTFKAYAQGSTSELSNAKITVDSVEYNLPHTFTKNENESITAIVSADGYTSQTRSVTFTNNNDEIFTLVPVATTYTKQFSAVISDTSTAVPNAKLKITGEDDKTLPCNITRNAGTVLNYSIEADGYTTISKSVTFNDNSPVEDSMSPILATKTIKVNCDVEGATLTINGESKSLNTEYSYNTGTEINVIVSKSGVNSYTNTFILTEDKTLTAYFTVTKTIKCTTADAVNAQIQINGIWYNINNGYDVTRNFESTETYTVKAENYESKSITVEYNENGSYSFYFGSAPTTTYTLKIVCNISDATLKINNITKQLDTSYTYVYGTYNIEVSKLGYNTYSESILLNENKIIEVTLEESVPSIILKDNDGNLITEIELEYNETSKDINVTLNNIQEVSTWNVTIDSSFDDKLEADPDSGISGDKFNLKGNNQ